MSTITSELKDRIKDASNIVDVIGQYITLKKRGINYIGCCPFHDEKTSSFTVSPTKNIYKCFGCGKSGDVISFVQEHEHISYPETIKLLAKRANIDVPEQEMTDDEHRRMNERESLRNAVNATHRLYINNLQQNPEAMAYVRSRDIDTEMISLFGLGYSENKNDVTFMASGAGYNMSIFEKLGLVKKSDANGSRFDAFRQRIMYPFYDISGNVCGFTGRHTDWKKGDPFGKFSNSDDSELFHKERLVYGLFQTKKYIAERDKVYLVEGQNDVITLFQRTIKNVAGGSGTAFSIHQAKQIGRFTRNFTIMYDGDAAGLKATLSALEILLPEDMNIRIIRLPETEDPDSFARKQDIETLGRTLLGMETDVVDFMYNLRKDSFADVYKKEEAITEVCKYLSLIPNEIVRKEQLKKVALLYKVGADDLKPKVKVKPEPVTDNWKDGFYGIEEAKELLSEGEPALITFKESTFLRNLGSEPYIYIRGKIRKDQIHQLRLLIHECKLEEDENEIKFQEAEDPRLVVLADLFRGNMKLEVEYVYRRQGKKDDIEDDSSTPNLLGFVDYYVTGYGEIIASKTVTENVKIKFIERCAEIISFTTQSQRAVQLKNYAKQLELGVNDLKAIVAPYLEKKKDKAVFESKRLDLEEDFNISDILHAPDYVTNDKVLSKIYNNDGYFPLMNKKHEPVGYMFKNEKGGGHVLISDFYMVPLLHIEHKDSALNKRVIQLNHMHHAPRYVEWQSSFMANLGKLNEKFIEEGSYNFDGSMMQWKKIWRNMSYKFTPCSELRTFGQQTEDFWAWTNAILHDVDGEPKIELTSELGITTHNGKNYYSPAFSQIFANQRHDDDIYENDRFFIYKETADDMKIDFDQWAAMMNEVYKINDNGKWAVLFSILSCFRDYIFQHARRFTTLFFIGPTGSGKSQVAFSMRSLFMSPNAPVFNLNSGTDAAFFMLLERNKNVITIMEEYNDSNITQNKFQGLKSAVLDGQGKTKVKDMNSKMLDASKINAVPVILGQEAAQQDDGSLSNRTILCDVPYNPKGEFTQEEKDLFNKLKSHENAGLCNVLTSILAIRKTVKNHYIELYQQEIISINKEIRVNVTNTEGLDRVIESMSMVSAICRLVEEKTELKLPFTYNEFFKIACDKVLKQMEVIGSSNKQSTFFHTISFLINQGNIKIGKELKVSAPGKVTIKNHLGQSETLILDPPEMKVLYISFDAIYPLYIRSVKDAMTRASLVSYFASNQAYIGHCKTTKFIWWEEKTIQRVVKNDDGTVTNFPEKIMEKKTVGTSAYVFNYDILKDLMDVDFERVDDEEPLTPEVEQYPNKHVPNSKENDLPF